MSKDDFYSEEEMSDLLGVSLRTLRNNRYSGVDHPPYKKIGNKIFYMKKDFTIWFEKLPLMHEHKKSHGKAAV